MSLRLKFSVVLSLLVLTLAVNVLLSIWSIRFLERELAWPLRYAQPVLIKLHTIKRIGESEAEALGVGRLGLRYEENAARTPPSPDEVSQQILDLEHEAQLEYEALKALPTVRVRSGGTTTDNLQRRSKQILASTHQWIESRTSADLDALIGQIQQRHELIERVEGRIVQDAGLAADYGEKLQFIIYIIVSTSVAGAIASIIYAAILIRRWVFEPVGQLRQAAQRFGKGEFSYRVETRSDDELGQLGDEFNHMASMILQMQQERIEQERLAAMGEMAQRTVHNLRTPLAGIRALAESTRNELDPDSDLLPLQERILNTVDRFEGWLQGMLRVSAPLELQFLDYQPTKLLEVVLANHRDAATAKDIKISYRTDANDLHATGDAHHLEHALTAIMSNAIDFAPRESTIEVEVNELEGYWTVRVCDHGPGVEAELHEAIFRPYFTTRKSGTGIGLAMVKRIIKQHQGEIVLKSPVDPLSGSGTAFVLKIPIHAGRTKE